MTNLSNQETIEKILEDQIQYEDMPLSDLKMIREVRRYIKNDDFTRNNTYRKKTLPKENLSKNEDEKNSSTNDDSSFYSAKILKGETLEKKNKRTNLIVEELNKINTKGKSQIKFVTKAAFMAMLVTLTSCMNSYKSTWDCPKVRGIGCSSIEYADSAAKDEIIMSRSKSNEIEVLVNTDILKSNYKRIKVK